MTDHEKALAILAEMEAKASAAAAGPWVTYEDENWRGVTAQDSAGRVSIGDVSAPRDTANFIASVRTDAPRAYAALRHAIEALDEQQEDGCKYGDDCPAGANHGQCRNCWAAWHVRAIAEKLEGR